MAQKARNVPASNLKKVSNPKRGCGQLVVGGSYVRGDAGDGKAVLEPWSWILGTQIVGERNFNVSVPPRQLEVINLPATLYYGQIVADNVALPDDAPDEYKKLPPIALIDHVGSTFYSPWSFAEEKIQYGPSRRIPQALAEQLAPFVPMPILFTHSWMPVVDAEHADALAEWARIERKKRLLSPTPDTPGWGLEKDDDHGNDHWIIPVTKAMHDATNGKEKAPGTFLKDKTLAKATLCTEQIFGASWITSVVYITSGSESRSDLNALQKRGIEPVAIDWDEE